MFGLKRRKSVNYYHYYLRFLPIAQNISCKDFPVSLTEKIEELIHNEEKRISEPRNLIAKLKIASRKDVQDDSATFIQFMTQYLNDPKATLGNVLTLLKELKRTDIFLEIKDQVDEIIKEYGERTEVISNSSEENGNKPDEDEIIGSDSESDDIQESSSSESTSLTFDSITSTNYSKENAHNSLLDKETAKQTSICNSEIDEDNCSECSNDQSVNYSKVKNECRRKTLRNKSEAILNHSSEEEYYDSNSIASQYSGFPDFSVTEDSDVDSVDHPKCVVEQDSTINAGKALQTLDIINYQSFSERRKLETTFNSQNKLNEKIEEKDKPIRSLHGFENQNLKLAQNIEISNEKFFSSLINQIFPTSVNHTQTKIFIFHSDRNNNVAFGLSRNLNECNFQAVAMGQLSYIWNINFCSLFPIVVDLADVVIPLITNELLQDIENQDENQISNVNGSNVKYGYNLLKTNYWNSGSINLQLIPVVMEGTSMKFRKHMELRMAKVLWREFSSLCNLISPFHESTRTARKIQNDVLLNSCV